MRAGLFLFGEWIEGFHSLLRENQSSWVILGSVQSLLLPVRARPCAWISGQDTNVLVGDLMALSVLCSVSGLLWLVQSCIVMVFLDPGLNELIGLSLVYFTALTGHTLYIF
jgi:hypothetical protein